MRREVQSEIEVSAKSVVLREDCTTSSTGSSNSSRESWIGQFSVTNRSKQRAFVFKIRGSNPKNYKLNNSCFLLLPQQSIEVQVRLLKKSLLSSQDLLQLKYSETKISNVNQSEGDQLAIQSLWNSIESASKKEIPSCKINQLILTIQLAEVSPLFKKTDSLMQSESLENALPLNSSKLQKNTFSKELERHSRFDQNNTPFNFPQNSENSNNLKPLSPLNKQLTLRVENLTQTSLASNRSSEGTHKNSDSNNNRAKIPPLDFSRSIVRKQSATLSPSQFSRLGYRNLQGIDLKLMYEKLLIQVDDQDKELFILSKERKALEVEWMSLEQQQEFLMNNEQSKQKSSVNAVNFSSALIIAILSLLFGIFLGN